MQPSTNQPKRPVGNIAPFSVSINQTNPRQRNRIHNQAIKRAKANIGKRRDQTFLDSDDQDDPNGVFGPLVGWTKAQMETHLVTEKALSSSPRLTVTSGGLRGDPFASFPISTDGCVLSAVDYFLQHYAPVHINPKKDQLKPGDSLSLSKKYFALALDNASMFELLVALAEASHAAGQGNTRGPTRDVLIHYGKGIEALRLKLEKNPACDDDATILSIMALLGLSLIYSDFAAFETHLIGLRRLIEMRGGIENLGWDGFLKNSIIGLESVWAYHENKKLSIATTEVRIKLEYPEHPFPPDLCISIARLPLGFRELCLAGNISLQVITILSRISEWVNQLQMGRKKGNVPLGDPNGTYMKQTHACIELVAHPRLSVLERLLCFSMVAVSVETFNKNRPFNPVHRRLLESLTESLIRFELQDLDRECLFWMSLVLAGPFPETLQDLSPPSALRDQDKAPLPRARDILLDKVLWEYPSARNWKWVKKAAQKFFCDDGLLETWSQTWDAGISRYFDALNGKTRRDRVKLSLPTVEVDRL